MPGVLGTVRAATNWDADGPGAGARTGRNGWRHHVRRHAPSPQRRHVRSNDAHFHGLGTLLPATATCVAAGCNGTLGRLPRRVRCWCGPVRIGDWLVIGSPATGAVHAAVVRANGNLVVGGTFATLACPTRGPTSSAYRTWSEVSGSNITPTSRTVSSRSGRSRRRRNRSAYRSIARACRWKNQFLGRRDDHARARPRWNGTSAWLSVERSRCTATTARRCSRSATVRRRATTRSCRATAWRTTSSSCATGGRTCASLSWAMAPRDVKPAGRELARERVRPTARNIDF